MIGRDLSCRSEDQDAANRCAAARGRPVPGGVFVVGVIAVSAF